MPVKELLEAFDFCDRHLSPSKKHKLHKQQFKEKVKAYSGLWI